MGFRGGGVKLTPPPSVSWFSSTPAGIGLRVTFLKRMQKRSQNIPGIFFVNLLIKIRSAYPVKVLIESYEERSLILSGLAALTKLLVHQRKLRQEYTSTGLYLGQGNTFLIDRRKLFYE